MGGSDTTEAPVDNLDDVLAHFGVKGMKWGHRKAVAPLGSDSKPPASADATKAAAAKATVKAGGTKALSTHELQALVTRMNLEQQYATLKGKEPSKFDKGQNAVKKIFSIADTANKAYNLYKSPLGQLVVDQIKNRAG